MRNGRIVVGVVMVVTASEQLRKGSLPQCAGDLRTCWRPRPACCGCSRCCRPGRDWTGPDLAERLGRDARGRCATTSSGCAALGYPVDADAGGGRRVPARRRRGAAAAAAGRRRGGRRRGRACAPRPAARSPGIEETSLRALAKLEQVLPSRLRHRVAALCTATVVAVPRHRSDGRRRRADRCSPAPAGTRERLRFDYVTHDGDASAARRSSRTGWSPAAGAGTWSAWDVDRGDWRTFRVDRITPRPPTGPRFAPRAFPEERRRGVRPARRRRGDLGSTARRCGCTRPPPRSGGGGRTRGGRLQPEAGGTCVLEVGSDTSHSSRCTSACWTSTSR